jgi:hypothetical protein
VYVRGDDSYVYCADVGTADATPGVDTSAHDGAFDRVAR